MQFPSHCPNGVSWTPILLFLAFISSGHVNAHLERYDYPSSDHALALFFFWLKSNPLENYQSNLMACVHLVLLTYTDKFYCHV